MAIVEINRNPSRRDLVLFGICWIVFFAVLGTLTFLRHGVQAPALTLWTLSVLVPLAGALYPRFLKLVFVGLSYAAWPIGFVLSHVVLALLYYLVFTPAGLLLRIFGHDPIQRGFDKTRKSYWIERDHRSDAKRYFRQY